MKVGGRRQLTIPSDLAYGAAGQGDIAKNEALVFVIDLLKVTPKPRRRRRPVGSGRGDVHDDHDPGHHHDRGLSGPVVRRVRPRGRDIACHRPQRGTAADHEQHFLPKRRAVDVVARLVAVGAFSS